MLTVALAAVAGLAVGGGAYAWRMSQDDPAPAVAAIGGPFQLVDQDGRPADERLLQGKWSALFFGYTACADYCPATLQTLQAAEAKLGPQARNLQVVLITVDPKRDTPGTLKAYLDGYEFPGGAHALTGAPEQTAAAAKAWRVFVKPSTAMPGMFDHFTGVYLVNPQGRFDRILGHDLGPDETARQIRAAMKA